MHGKELIGRSGNSMYIASFSSQEAKVINTAIRGREMAAAARAEEGEDPEVPDMETGVFWRETKDGTTNVFIPSDRAEDWLNDVTDTLCLYRASLMQHSGRLLKLDPEQYEELADLWGRHVAAAVSLTEVIDRQIIEMNSSEDNGDQE